MYRNIPAKLFKLFSLFAKNSFKPKNGQSSVGDLLNQKPLPKVPVPPIEHTLGRYLEYARVVADGNSEAIARTEEAVTKFFKVGIELQKKLEKIAEREENWVNRYWLPEMYLKVRLPLPMFSNPVYVFPQQKFRNLNEQINYTASLVRGIAEYKDLIDK
ncbi:Choline O-acetyltransferase [Toxocara canis]|uniref:Choline O-acetyltransferase n=1 Tax=Toxocara canis TaxID=6265 RepID=A0A0B2VTI9_TOXCA|nr:Choline O-acetyltransferase [Toxocara canis]